MRMYYERRMQFLGLPMYRSDDEARVVWAAMLDTPMNADVRDYFNSNLKNITGSNEVEV